MLAKLSVPVTKPKQIIFCSLQNPNHSVNTACLQLNHAEGNDIDMD